MTGTGPIAYIRKSFSTSTVCFYVTHKPALLAIPVVSALIFVLGIDLVKEALWDTRHRVNRTEYITIASIMVAMTVWDFVKGVLWGIVVSCEWSFLLFTQCPNDQRFTQASSSSCPTHKEEVFGLYTLEIPL